LDNKTIFIRLSFAFILGLLIGLEREIYNKPAGMRTHIMVSLGSALTMLFGIYMAHQYPGVDPTRISAQVISGIGFLCALCVLKEQHSIIGLTTAASIWVVACIGLAVGGGFITGACIATAFILFDLFFLGKFDPFKAHRERNLEFQNENLKTKRLYEKNEVNK
jgi:putative Mg2+ transporter-C (MgtC) family protein